MCALYSTNKGKSQRFKKIINRMSGILNSQSLSIIIDITKLVTQIIQVRIIEK